jgi:hypothetical protein
MFRNLFAVFLTFMLGVGSTATARTDAANHSFNERIEAAQKTIEKLKDAAEEYGLQSGAYRIAASSKTTAATKGPTPTAATGKDTRWLPHHWYRPPKKPPPR